jgi:hypothetical protein
LFKEVDDPRKAVEGVGRGKVQRIKYQKKRGYLVILQRTQSSEGDGEDMKTFLCRLLNISLKRTGRVKFAAGVLGFEEFRSVGNEVY